MNMGEAPRSIRGIPHILTFLSLSTYFLSFLINFLWFRQGQYILTAASPIITAGLVVLHYRI